MESSRFDFLFQSLAKDKTRRLVIANGVDTHSVEAAYRAKTMNLVDVVLTGSRTEIEKSCHLLGISPGWYSVVDCEEDQAAVDIAVSMCREQKADLIMKGLISTDRFMRAILNKETGLLSPGALLSHVTVIQNAQYGKPLLVSDVAIIPIPTLEQKVIITGYLIEAAHRLGILKPRVAFIAATEQVIPKMKATTDALELKEMWLKGLFPGSVCDGPLALDVALDEESAFMKNVDSPVAGEADCLLFPNIESGNVFYKTNTKLCGAQTAAIVMGTTIPAVLSSRGDTVDTKINSIALAAKIG